MELFTLPTLPYSFNALEPYIDAETMEIHYTKHHKSYLDNLNKLVIGHEAFFNGKTIEEILSSVEKIPERIRQEVVNQGGGYLNHNLFWPTLSPNGGGQPMGELAKKINETFNSFAEFKSLLSQAAISQFGSGWGWLVLNNELELEVMKTLNQNTPLSIGKIPLLGIDVWEHAYYLKYQNRRPEYVEAIWHVINWDEVERRYDEEVNNHE